MLPSVRQLCVSHHHAVKWLCWSTSNTLCLCVNTNRMCSHMAMLVVIKYLVSLCTLIYAARCGEGMCPLAHFSANLALFHFMKYVSQIPCLSFYHLNVSDIIAWHFDCLVIGCASKETHFCHWYQKRPVQNAWFSTLFGCCFSLQLCYCDM